jgi:hypothetical protein
MLLNIAKMLGAVSLKRLAGSIIKRHPNGVFEARPVLKKPRPWQKRALRF